MVIIKTKPFEDDYTVTTSEFYECIEFNLYATKSFMYIMKEDRTQVSKDFFNDLMVGI